MRGVKSIVWTAENDSKMLQALLVYGYVTVDASAAQNIATEMGPNIPPAAITTHIQVLRAKAKKQGITPTTAFATTKKRIAPSSANIRDSNKKVRAATGVDGAMNVKSEDDSSEATFNHMTPPETPAKEKSSKQRPLQPSTPNAKSTEDAQPCGMPSGDGAKKRCSPRSGRSVNYRLYSDEEDDEEDEDGETAFEKYRGPSDEVSAASDEEFKATKQEDEEDDGE